MDEGQGILIGIIIGSMMLMILFILFIAVIHSRQNKGLKSLKAKSAKTNKQDMFYQKLYILLSKSLLSKRYIYDIRSRIEILHNFGEAALRKKVVGLYLKLLIFLGVLIGTFIVMTDKLYIIVLFIIAIWFLGETVIDYFVVRIRNKLLKQQINFNNNVRHKYYEMKMVDEAIYEACKELNDGEYEIGIQGNKIYDALTAKDAEKEVLNYYETAPNKYLKMLAGLAYMTQEYGDTYIKGSSVFMKNLNYLSSALRIEVFKRDRLNYALKSLNIIVLVPLFFITPIKSWASRSFLPLGEFYSSKYGLILEIIMFAVIFICYMAIRKIQQFDDRTLHLFKKKPIEEKIYKRIYFIIDRLLPSKNRKRVKLQTKLNESFSRLKIEAFYTRRVLLGSACFIITLLVIVMMHRMTINNVLYSPTMPEGFLGGQLSIEEEKKAYAITLKDRQIIHEVGRKVDLTDIETHIKSEEASDSVAQDTAANRIYEKIVLLNNQYIKWWEVLLCLVSFFLGYNIPYLSIRFQKEVRKIDMEDEVSGFQAIILMLMHHKRISVEEILEWMEMFSFTFREPIQNCINNFAYGVDEALEELKNAADFKSFQKIIEQLQMAANDLSLVQAFDELESEKNYYQEQRKETNERIINKKTGLGRIFGFLPIYTLLLVYLMIPMLVSSINEIDIYFSKLAV